MPKDLQEADLETIRLAGEPKWLDKTCQRILVNVNYVWVVFNRQARPREPVKVPKNRKFFCQKSGVSWICK